MLHRDGVIEMSYRELAAKDAIVGTYPALTSEEKPHPDVAAHLDIRSLSFPWVDGVFLKVTLETRGPALSGDPALKGVRYRAIFDSLQPAANERAHVRLAGPCEECHEYLVFGPGVSRNSDSPACGIMADNSP